MVHGSFMSAEIREQPEILGRILGEGRQAIERVVGELKAREIRFVLFAARGTSDHAALYAKYLVETELGLPAGLVSPSTATVYEARPNMKGVLFIAVSQSGSSPDLIEPLVRAREGGAVTVAVTNSPDSPLARAAEYSLDVLAGRERAVAATKTYTAQLLTLFLLVSELAGGGVSEAERLPGWASEVLSREAEIAQLSVRYRFAEQFVITARGYNYPTARESALKLMETSYVLAHAFSGADLLHGPVAMLDRNFPVIAVAPAGKGSDALKPVLERVVEVGSDLLVLGGPELVEGALCVPLHKECPESLSPILAILPVQQFAWHLATARGYDPDQPRGLQKITETW